MKILVSRSSGKDSAWTPHMLRQRYPTGVTGLFTTTDEGFVCADLSCEA